MNLSTMNSIAIAALLLFAIQVLADDRDDKASEECAEESGVDLEILANAKNGELVDDANLKAHILCWLTKNGSLDESGEIREEVVRKRWSAKLQDEEVVNKLVEVCVVKKATAEETAFDLVDCYFKNRGQTLKFV